METSAVVRTLRWAAVAIAVVAAQIAIGLASSKSWTHVAIIAVFVVMVPLVVFSPMTCAALAFPGSYATWRLGAGGLDLSYADAVLVVMVVICIPKADWKSVMFKRLAVVAGVYLTVLAIPLAATPTMKGMLEWFHRANFLFGALIVGSAIAISGKATLAVRFYLAGGVAVSIAAIVNCVTRDFAPAYPFGLHKNGAGFLLTAALILCIVSADVVKLPGSIRGAVQVTLLLGVLSCQSRGSAATFIVILFINAFRARRKSLITPALGALALAAMIWTSTSKQLSQEASEAKFNPLETREATYITTLEVWRESPLFGLGLRYWNEYTVQADHGFRLTEPHNLVISALGETGLVGAVGVLGLNFVLVDGLRRRRDPLGQAAFYIVIARFVAGLGDIYWVAGPGTLPWLVLGLAASSAGIAPKTESNDSGSADETTAPPPQAALG